MMIAHGAHDCPGYPGQSAKFNGHVGGRHDISEHTIIFWAYGDCNTVHMVIFTVVLFS